jgi:hypothetical protein
LIVWNVWILQIPQGLLSSLARLGDVEPDGRGGYFTSNRAGRITWISPTGTDVTLLDTTSEKINQADFEFLPEQNLLIVPTFHDNRLIAYKAVPGGDQ